MDITLLCVLKRGISLSHSSSLRFEGLTRSSRLVGPAGDKSTSTFLTRLGVDGGRCVGVLNLKSAVEDEEDAG